MLGGQIVNISGPCFQSTDRILCTFDTESVVGTVIDRNRAICIQPFLLAQGYVRFQVSVNTEPFKYKGKYFVGKFSSSLVIFSFGLSKLLFILIAFID